MVFDSAVVTDVVATPEVHVVADTYEGLDGVVPEDEAVVSNSLSEKVHLELT